MRHYEIVVMVSAEQHDRGTAMAQRYQEMISGNGGAVHRFEDWGNRRLAYPIGKRVRARYFLFNIECNAETLDQLKNDFRYSESVIRTLVVRREQAVVDESPIMRELKNPAANADEDGAEEGADSTAAKDGAKGGAKDGEKMGAKDKAADKVDKGAKADNASAKAEAGGDVDSSAGAESGVKLKTKSDAAVKQDDGGDAENKENDDEEKK